MIRKTLTSSAIVALAMLMSPTISAQETKPHADHAHGEMAAMPTMGVAVIMPTKGSKVRGMLKLMQMGDDLRLTGKIRNLTPGDHGFHIHEFGDFRDMDGGTSAGGHFNPSGVPHGSIGHGHVGDLGNITADSEGVATVDITVEATKLHFVLGRAFVVHADKDDLTSQPSGNAGARVALGLIGVGNAEFKPAPKQ